MRQKKIQTTPLNTGIAGVARQDSPKYPKEGCHYLQQRRSMFQEPKMPVVGLKKHGSHGWGVRQVLSTLACAALSWCAFVLFKAHVSFGGSGGQDRQT